MKSSTSSGNNQISQVICPLLIQIYNIPRVNFKFEVSRIFKFILSEQKTLDACFLQYMIHMYCSILLNETCLRGNTRIATSYIANLWKESPRSENESTSSRPYSNNSLIHTHILTYFILAKDKKKTITLLPLKIIRDGHNNADPLTLKHNHANCYNKCATFFKHVLRYAMIINDSFILTLCNKT